MAHHCIDGVFCADAMSVGVFNNGVMKGEKADDVKKKELGRGVGRRVLRERGQTQETVTETQEKRA